MKKFISLITSGMLTAMSIMPLTVNATNNTVANKSAIADTSIISNKSNSEEIPVASTQTTIKTDELKATFGIDTPSYDVYVGEQIDLNNIIFNLYVQGYSPNGNFIPEPTLLNYSFSVGSGKHSDCYIYYMDDFYPNGVDTSKPGRYLIHCKLKGDFKETFDIENSGCPDIPDGKYEMTMRNDNFNIIVNVIDPSVTELAYVAATTTVTKVIDPITTKSISSDTGAATEYQTTVTEPIITELTSPNIAVTTEHKTIAVIDPVTTKSTSSDTVLTESRQTTAHTEELQPATVVLPPIENEIRAMYTCQETYTVNVGEKFNPDDIELSVYARSAIPNQYQIDYKFTIGSGKHSDCFTYDAGGVDTSKPGTYYVKVTVLPNVKDTYVIDSSNSYNVPEGEYEMITEGIKMFSMIPVYVTEPAPSVSVVGDANDDGTVDLADASAIIQYIGNEKKYELSPQGFVNADCNADGKITGADAMAIQKLEAKQITQLPYKE